MNGLNCDMNSDPLQISVLMSVFNGSKYLDESIPSILNQTMKGFEFIIVNDGSSDNSLSIIQSYANIDPRIVVLNKDNSGLADSLNQGMQKSKGKWIARIDCDDISMPTRLENQFLYVSKNPKTVYVGCGMFQVDDQGGYTKEYTYPNRHKHLLNNLRFVRKFPPHSSAFFSREVAKKIGGYRPLIKRGQDWDLWLRLSNYGSLACLNDCLVVIRHHRDQISNDNNGKDQILFSRMAITDYWIRLISQDEIAINFIEDFEVFKIFIYDSLENADLFSYQIYKNKLKKYLSQKLILNFLGYAFSKPLFFIRLMASIIVGETLTKKIAHKWIQVHK